MHEPKGNDIKKYNPGELIFAENDKAGHLYIIQKGQVRLFTGKGRGYVEISILRQGEILGELAALDENVKKRACSAEALTETEALEISLTNFDRTLEKLPNWLRVMVNSICERLRKSNLRVKALEENSVSTPVKGGFGEYRFLKNLDIVRFLAQLYLVFKSYGSQDGDIFTIPKKRLGFYLKDLFNFPEVKYESIIQALNSVGFLTVQKNEDGSQSISVKDVDNIRSQYVFFNNQRFLEDDKKLLISSRCEAMLKKLLDHIDKESIKTEKVKVNLTEVLKEINKNGLDYTADDLSEAVLCKLIDEIIVDPQIGMTTLVNYSLLKKVFPSIRIQNEIRALNNKKSHVGRD